MLTSILCKPWTVARPIWGNNIKARCDTIMSQVINNNNYNQDQVDQFLLKHHQDLPITNYYFLSDNFKFI